MHNFDLLDRLMQHSAAPSRAASTAFGAVSLWQVIHAGE